jgi:anti-sigma-K factor RskA
MNDIHHLTGAYAVDALDEDERARFEAHLTGCPDCRAEVDSLREAAGLLASTTEATPPPTLRDSVLAGISQVRPLPPAAEPATGPAPAPSRRRRWFPLLAAAVLVAAAGVGVAVTDPFGGEDSSQVPLSAVERVLRADDAQSVSVDLGEAGRATLTRSASVGKAVIRTEDMAPAPEGKVYELWLQSPAGEMVPAGLMPDDADAEVVLEGDASRATAAGITVEPDGGSPQPTSAPIALFDFSTAS